jgi:serine/threonine protein kinase
MIQGLALAKTYVGTPYYMSPEICGAEQYSSATDIWSLGCLIYELCTQRPPFVADSHPDLIVKIKRGSFAALPPQYSSELVKVVGSCLQVNYHARPTAAQLLSLPMVCVVRKQQEALQLHKQLRQRLEEMEKTKSEIRREVDATLRREWQVRAQLEVNRVIQEEKQRLNDIFETEVNKRVLSLAQEAERQERRASDRSLGGTTVGSSDESSSQLQNSGSSSSRSLSGDESHGLLRRGLGRLSLESPATTAAGGRPTRTPLTRAHTVVSASDAVASPMDVHMADPSPMSIASLALSPRKDSTSTAPGLSNNIFARGRALAGSNLSKAMFSSDDDSEWEKLETETVGADDGNKRTCSDSPTCEPSKRTRRRTSAAPSMKRLTSAPSLAPAAGTAAVAGTAAQARRPASAVPVVATSPSRGRKAAEMASPSRARAATKAAGGSPSRRAGGFGTGTGTGGLRSKKLGGDAGGVGKMAMRNQVQPAGVQGRTLLELAQARAGGVDRSMVSPVKATTWDPERDEMPSPFLARGRAR